MDFFDRHKALIITVLIFSILILLMYNIKISNESKKIRETLIELNEIIPPPPPEEEPEPKEEQPEQDQQPKPTVQTHQAFNQNREESQRNLESRLDEIFQKNAAEREAAEEDATQASSGDIALNARKREAKQQASQGDNSTKKTSVEEGSLRNSSISFSLRGRTAVFIPNPIYTCDTPGKVVINISVNSFGDVVRTSVNKSASTTSNECLTDQALQYAKEAKFSRLPGRDTQPGTITYNFQN